MTRKRKTENDLVVSAGAAPARRATGARTRTKRAAEPANPLITPAAEPEFA